ncbi:hypothetical protein UZ35_01585 [Heyndrickxia coagulans]|nr:hypothetical protein UZ35_01585 [Heyndrickxia coagulans]
MEVHHAILYEGWETNGKRVSLRQPTVIMTTEDIQTFWDEVQATAANTYSLEKAHVITNSDGGTPRYGKSSRPFFEDDCYEKNQQKQK